MSTGGRPPRRCARSSGRRWRCATSCPTSEPAGRVAGVGVSHDELVRRLVEEFDAQVLDDDQEDSKVPQPGQPNMQQLLKQAQKMQQDMMAAQEALKDETVEASAGGGMVKVTVTGDLEIKSITIDPQAVDPEDVELLQDMVLAAVNEGLRSAQELAASKMGGIAGGLGGLGLPGF